MITPTLSDRRHFVEIYDLDPATVSALTRLFGPSQSHAGDEPLVLPPTAHEVSWLGYESFLSGIGNRLLRHTYSDGTLEIMSPRKFERETTKSLLRRFVQSLTLQRRMPVQSLGTTTLASPGKCLGIEPDELFHFGPAFKSLTGDYLNVDVHGSPGLAVEVVAIDCDNYDLCVNACQVDRGNVLGLLGIAEVWFVRRGVVQICRNDLGHRLVPVEHSAFLENVSAAMLTDCLEQRFRLGENEALRRFLAAANSD